MTKDEIRSELRAKRRALTAEEQNVMSVKITEQLISLPCIMQAETVMIYMSAFKEPSTAEIAEYLKSSQKKIVVPISNTQDYTITPVYLSGALSAGAYGIPEPTLCKPADIKAIDVALIPGIGFDLSGSRIGFGKGYYDRFLAEFTGLKIGICYDFQMLADIPTSEHDVKMDLIITEKRIYDDF